MYHQQFLSNLDSIPYLLVTVSLSLLFGMKGIKREMAKKDLKNQKVNTVDIKT